MPRAGGLRAIIEPASAKGIKLVDGGIEQVRKGFIIAIAALVLLGGAMFFSSGKDSLKVGDRAPDFTLTDQNGARVSLSDFRGKKNVVLAFYIKAFTSG